MKQNPLPMTRHDFDRTDFMRDIQAHGDGVPANLNFNAIDIGNIGYWIYQNAFYDGVHAAGGISVKSAIK
jgi:hypothetical protein